MSLSKKVCTDLRKMEGFNGRTIFVQDDGTLAQLRSIDKEKLSVPKAYLSRRDDRTMRIVVSKQAADSMKKKLKYPGIYTKESSGSSYNIRDYTTQRLTQKTQNIYHYRFLQFDNQSWDLRKHNT